MIETLLRRMIKVGDLTLHLPGGRVERLGDGTGTPVVARMTGKGLRRIAANPGLGLGAARGSSAPGWRSSARSSRSTAAPPRAATSPTTTTCPTTSTAASSTPICSIPAPISPGPT
jgi:hypothetical protein